MRKTMVLFFSLILIGLAMMACGGSPSKKLGARTAQTPEATPNLQATIDAAVASTCGARSGLPATEISLNATATAIASALPQIVPTPMPSEVVAGMPEDQLEAMIAERVRLAWKAAGLAADKSVEAIADGTIDQNEQETLYTYWYYTDEVIAYADEAIAIYYNLYSDLASGTLAPLTKTDADLKAISQQVRVVLPILENIGQALEQGQGQNDKVLRQIGTAAETAQSKIANAKSQVQTWTASLKTAAKQRVDNALAVKPKKVAKNRKAAINKANDYIKSVRSAIADQKITQAELANIAQQGANAAASLTKKGGEQLAPLAGSVNEITAQVATGQLPAVKASLDNFQAALPAKP